MIDKDKFREYLHNLLDEDVMRIIDELNSKVKKFNTKAHQLEEFFSELYSSLWVLKKDKEIKFIVLKISILALMYDEIGYIINIHRSKLYIEKLEKVCHN